MDGGYTHATLDVYVYNNVYIYIYIIYVHLCIYIYITQIVYMIIYV